MLVYKQPGTNQPYDTIKICFYSTGVWFPPSLLSVSSSVCVKLYLLQGLKYININYETHIPYIKFGHQGMFKWKFREANYKVYSGKIFGNYDGY